MMLGQALKRLVLKYTAWAKLHPQFPFKLVKQNGDGSLELQPDTQMLAGQSNVPLRVGAPGMVLKLAAGSRGVLVFENGDRKAPVAIALFDRDAGELLEYELHASTKISLVSPAVMFGSTAAVEQLVLGTTFRGAHSLWHTALGIFLVAAGVFGTAVATGATALATAFDKLSGDAGLQPTTTAACTTCKTAMGVLALAATAFATACTAAGVALTTFEGGSTTYLSTTSKTT